MTRTKLSSHKVHFFAGTGLVKYLKLTDKKQVKKATNDRPWIILICFLLIIEITWLAIEMKWIHLSWTKSNKNLEQLKPAGHIIKNRNQLKRRAQDQLVWEDIKENEVLYYNDSILTLSQSSAKIYLKDQTDLQLSENTLVIIEEPSSQIDGEIRLRFKRGDLKARNPYVKSKIEGDDWTVELEKGTEVALRKDLDQFEFQVLSGKALLKTKENSSELTSDSVVTLSEQQQIEQKKINQKLKIENKSLERFYIFTEQLNFSLRWLGQADQVHIKSSDGQVFVQNVESKEDQVNTWPFQLNKGSYQIRLTNKNNELSLPIQVEVLDSPKIVLKSPLPRERKLLNQNIEFIWTTNFPIKSYKIKALKKDNEIEFESTSDVNSKLIQINSESDLRWTVEGVDEDGFTIPSYFYNDLFIRQEALSAPKLKNPKIEKSDSSQNSSKEFKGHTYFWFKTLFRLFNPLAFAQSKNIKTQYELTFEWEPVKNADHYIIEISSRSDFQNPEIIKKVNKPYYVWKTSQYTKYFWRVASGRQTLLGQFSEPLEIKESEVQIVEKKILPEPIKKVEVESIKSYVEEIEKLKINESLPDNDKATTTYIQKDLSYKGHFLSWLPHISQIHLKENETTEARLSGVQMMGFQYEYSSIKVNTDLSDDKLDKSYFKINMFRQNWKNDNALSLQSDLKTTDGFLNYFPSTFNKSFNHHYWGFNVSQFSYIKRISNQEIKSESKTSLGLSYMFSNLDQFTQTNHYYLLNFNAGYLNKGYQIVSDLNYRYKLPIEYKLNLGIGLNIEISRSGESLRNHSQIYLMITAPFTQ